MGEWATANRVKKVNTRMNKAARAKVGVDRDMLEPDETDGPVVLEELGTWPDDTSLEEHLAEDEDTRIFPGRASRPGRGRGRRGDVHGAGRRSLVACGGFWDGKLKVWRLHDADDGAGAGAGGDPDELLVAAAARFDGGNPRRGATTTARSGPCSRWTFAAATRERARTSAW